jgi:GT2 family glycosyltransferase
LPFLAKISHGYYLFYMNVSVIIVNYNTKDLLVNCINSIYECTHNIDIEIIVVDNASVDGSNRVIKEQYSNVILLESKKNLGFGKANNLGAKIAKGKYLFFLNSDTIILNNAINLFFQFNEEKEKILQIGVTGGILVDDKIQETASFGPLPTKRGMLKFILGLLPPFTKMTANESRCINNNGYVEVGYVSGADMFLSKSTFDRIGGFDSNIFMYYEETDLQFRLKRANYCNYVIAGTQIIHLEGASFGSVKKNNIKRLMVVKSMMYYFKKHSDHISFFLFKVGFLTVRVTTMLDPSYSWREKKEYILQIIRS